MKRFIAMLLAAALVCGIIGAVPVSAANEYEPKRDKYITVYLGGEDGNQDDITRATVDINISNCYAEPDSFKYYGDADKLTLKKVKYSESSLKALIRLTTCDSGEYEFGYRIYGARYNHFITVKNYTNPVSRLKITGVKNGKNIASRTKKNRIGTASLTKNVSNARLTVKAASGWKLRSVKAYRVDSNGKAQKKLFSKKYNTTKSTVCKIGSLKKNRKYKIRMVFRNRSNSAELTLEYSIN